MASNNEINSLLSSSNDKSMSKKHLNEHEETIKSDQMASKKSLSNDGEVSREKIKFSHFSRIKMH
jgi:hypothetical protein